MIPEGSNLDDYDFELPERLIAQTPPAARGDSRLFVLDRAANTRQHRRVVDLPDLLRAGDLLVLNTTRVIPARLYGVRDATGGKAEALFLRPTADGQWELLLKTRGYPEVGESFTLADGALRFVLRDRQERGRCRVDIATDAADALPDVVAILDEAGTMPLPPYIRRDGPHDARRELDRERYQTVYAREHGAIAAPTAGLHFTRELLAALSGRGVAAAEVLLHVGLGTFQPVEVADIREHRMHAERFEVPDATADLVNRTRRNGGRVIAVGTTSLRSLESAWDDERHVVAGRSGETRIFLRPGVAIHAIDGLITNFHLPKSTLLFLMASLCGREALLDAYREAIAREYRFFSYGDAMLVL